MFEGIRKRLSEAIKQAVKRENVEERRPAPEEDEEELEDVAEGPEKPNEESTERETEESSEENSTDVAVQPEPAYPEDIEASKEKEDAAAEPETKEEAPEKVEKQRNPSSSPSSQPDVKISKITKLKGVFSGTVRLSDSDIERFSDAMMTSLLQSDVSFNTATAFTEDLKEKLKERMPSKNIESELVKKVRASLMDVLNSVGEGVDIFAFIDKRVAEGVKPVKILFLGPNGTGKTTTIGKVAYALKKKNESVVLSASDTFRAAAIEQTEYHAAKIGVPVVKSKYGADPASVAFDAINYATAHSIDVVLIDSAGRQETNKNLLSEVSKMVRVTKPDLTIYVGESTSGNAIENQV
ncbi:signal recognition particle receptor subunit alpha, partial [Candidatus Marsarchaeota archaeon]|nr:signal recognition particle receptor subunit alpha [Candidatus Marsarchaeota archaeon]